LRWRQFSCGLHAKALATLSVQDCRLDDATFAAREGETEDIPVCEADGLHRVAGIGNTAAASSVEAETSALAGAADEHVIDLPGVVAADAAIADEVLKVAPRPSAPSTLSTLSTHG
jgi:hypothetical protein